MIQSERLDLPRGISKAQVKPCAHCLPGVKGQGSGVCNRNGSETTWCRPAWGKNYLDVSLELLSCGDGEPRPLSSALRSVLVLRFTLNSERSFSFQRRTPEQQTRPHRGETHLHHNLGRTWMRPTVTTTGASPLSRQAASLIGRKLRPCV